MHKVENECVGCTDLGLPCQGSSCPNRHVLRYYCDKCGDETEELYEFEGQELCEDCLLKEVPKVNAEDAYWDSILPFNNIPTYLGW